MRRYVSKIIGSITLILFIALLPPAHAAQSGTQPAAPQAGMQILKAASAGMSRPLGSLAPMKAAPDAPVSAALMRQKRLPIPKAQSGACDGVCSGTSRLQAAAPVGSAMPSTGANFDGVSNIDGVLPPDTQGAIGIDPATNKKYYVQWVNLSFQIWDVTNPAAPVSVYGPAAGNTLWAGTGTICESNNDGDPVTLFDHLANRWVMSQFALGFPNNFHQCIAVSQSADPTGSWYRYDFKISSTNFNDYPKLGVWPDGYYMSVNQFNGSTDAWAGAGVAVFERAQMLSGLDARMIYFDLGAVTTDYGGILPSSLDGPAPAAGTPNYFMEWDDSTWLGDAADTLRIWEFKTDWTTPANSTFGLNSSYDPNVKITTGNVDPNLCGNGSNDCIAQPGTGVKLDPISDRLMHRLQYRDFGTYQSLVCNHTVDATSADKAGIHWFELRNTGSGFAMYQEGVHAPDADNRWMGSIAMDISGNIALGYSVSSSSTYPSVRYAGRLADDPLNGLLTQGEASMVAGAGSQTHSAARWGDYSSMTVDPEDGCTFWYTQEYYAATSSAGWKTRIGSFKFPSCSSEPTGTISGTVTDSASPIAGATVEATGGFSTVTNAVGHYTLRLVAGTYDVTASKYGYISRTVSGIAVTPPAALTQNFTLAAAPAYAISGSVTDNVTGWPLYARLDISGFSGSPVFTNPVTGAYSATIASGGPYTFTASAMSGGYKARVAPVTVSGASTQNFALPADPATCSAPGYDNATGSCKPTPSGGLVIGSVRDANTGAVVLSAAVQDVALNQAALIDSSADPAAPARMYVIGLASGAQTLTASAYLYGSDTRSPTVVAGGTVGQDFSLPTGDLTADPLSLSFSVTTDAPTASQTLKLNNTGGLPVGYEVFVIGGAFAGYTPTGPFADNTRHTGPPHLNDKDASSLRINTTPRGVTRLAAGTVASSWSTGLAGPWGIGFNTEANDLWLGNPSAGHGDDLDHRFTTAGVNTGDTIDTAPWVGTWAADMTYNTFTNTLWQVNVGGDTCIYEIDPVTKTSTGNRICPAFGTSERGLAFDPRTNTYYAGSWNDGIINHFVPTGVILDSAATGLSISGLAFNPLSGHLFVMTNGATASDPTVYDVYVLDTRHAYANLGGFNIMNGSLKAFGDYEQAGLEIDCSGRLWAVNQATKEVYAADSGESGGCSWQATWLTAAPATGSISAGGRADIAVTVNAAGFPAHTYSAHLRVIGDTPYGIIIIPVSVKVTASGGGGGVDGGGGTPSKSTTTTVPATTTTSAPATTTTPWQCPAKTVLGAGSPKLDNLRAVRDGLLARSAAGRMITGIYYDNAESINEALDRSPALRAAARKFFEVAAALAGGSQ